MTGLFSAIGEDAKKSATTKNVDLKTAYIRLKENESVRVRVLGVTDYVEYKAQGDFNLGIYTQPMIDNVIGTQSPLTIASKSGVEGFEKLTPKKRYIFALYDLDMKQVRFWDASKTQATKMIGDIEEYAENIDEICFNFKRVGTKTETVYSLNPVLKMGADVKDVFEQAGEIKVDMKDFEAVLIPRSVEQQIEALKQAGFPVDEFFAVNADVEGIDLSKDENPTDNF